MESYSKKGNLIGGILLIAGSCIGAGMLGLPVLSAMAGFKPTVAMFLVSWLFMFCTGLLLLEVNLWFKEEVSIVSMAGRTLGFPGKCVAWSVFLFLFYSLMVAYISASGELCADFLEEWVHVVIPRWVGSLFMSALFGLMVYFGTGAVDRLNRVLMLGLILSYILLVMMGGSYVKSDLLKHENWKESIYVLPVLFISFGYHNLIPTLTNYLKRDSKQMRLAILIGSLIPLLIYLAWEWLILGLVPLEGEGSFQQAIEQQDIATHALKSAVGASWIVDVGQSFAFFALVTSFLGVALSFVDFLADGLQVKKDAYGKALLCLFVLAPPFLFSLYYPHIFLTALNFAGGFGAVVLFGILPASMVWVGRYRLFLGKEPLVPGGKITLSLVILFSSLIVIIELLQELNKI